MKIIHISNKKKWIDESEYKKYVLNKSTLKTEDITSGHCMIFTLIISHLLSKEKYDLETIIIELNKLNKNDMIDVIMGYTEQAIENLKLISV